MNNPPAPLRILFIGTASYFLGTVTSTLMIFGEAQVKNLVYPVQSVVRMVKLGFIERYDIYGIAVMVLDCVIRMSTFQIILNLGIDGVYFRWNPCADLDGFGVEI